MAAVKVVVNNGSHVVRMLAELLYSCTKSQQAAHNTSLVDNFDSRPDVLADGDSAAHRKIVTRFIKRRCQCLKGRRHCCILALTNANAMTAQQLAT